MGDMAWGDITIGGILPERLLKEFVESFEYFMEGEDYRRYVKNKIDSKNGTFYHEDSEASSGQFEELEDFCRAHSLSFVANASPTTVAMADTHWWTPGMKEIHYQITSNDHEALVEASKVEEIQRIITEVLSAILKGNIRNAPKLINSKNQMEREFGVHVLKHNKIDPFEFLKEWYKDLVPDAPEIPPLKIID